MVIDQDIDIVFTLSDWDLRLPHMAPAHEIDDVLYPEARSSTTSPRSPGSFSPPFELGDRLDSSPPASKISPLPSTAPSTELVIQALDDVGADQGPLPTPSMALVESRNNAVSTVLGRQRLLRQRHYEKRYRKKLQVRTPQADECLWKKSIHQHLACLYQATSKQKRREWLHLEMELYKRICAQSRRQVIQNGPHLTPVDRLQQARREELAIHCDNALLLSLHAWQRLTEIRNPESEFKTPSFADANVWDGVLDTLFETSCIKPFQLPAFEFHDLSD
ncbi:hypothetical protein PINS_up004463 [Pythium insidiosum]|nr:hypothetical protein PINS_up004463 [Pythium insidiosum]